MTRQRIGPVPLSTAPPAETAPTPAPSPAPSPADIERRRMILRRVVWGVGGVLGALFLVWLVLFITKGRFLKGPFERVVASATGREVRVGGDFQFYFAPITVHFVAERFSVSNPGWASRPNLIEARRIDARIAPLSLLFGRYRLPSLDMEGAAVDLEWHPRARRNTWTFGDGGDGERLELPVIRRARLAGTTVRYRDPQMQLAADIGFDTVRSDAARIGDAVTFAGGGQVRRTPFAVAGAMLSPDATVARGRNRLALAARAAGNRILVTGDLPGLAEIERVPLAVEARGGNIATLLGIIGVAVPATRAYRMAGTMVKDGDRYAFTDLRGRFGASDIAGRLTVDNVEPRIRLDADLTTRSLDIVDLAPFVGYDPDLIDRVGVAAAAGTGQGRLLPDARLQIDALANFDATLRYRIARLRSQRLPVSDIDLTLALDDRRLTLKPLTFTLARGTLTANVDIDARRRPAVTDYDIRLAQTNMGRLLAGFGVAESGTSGTLGGRITLRGVGDTVHRSLSTAGGRIALVMPAGALTTRNVELSELDIGTFVQKMFQERLEEPVEINCGLIAFTVRRGVATADPILIDTRKNVVVGTGGFSFESEAVDMAFRADSKRFSLFSGQSPVALRGAFASPAIDPITPELLGRAGAGLGLAVVATPLAGLLAFIDPGDAKAAACGPVLRGANAASQRTEDGEPRRDVAPEAPKGEEEERPRRRRFLGIF